MGARARIHPTVYLGTFVLMLSHAGGCIGWQGGTAREIEPFPPARLQVRMPKKILVAVDRYRSASQELTPKVLASVKDNIRRGAEQVFNASWYFHAVPGDNADFVLQMDVFHDDSRIFLLTLLSMMTLTVIPTYAVDIYTVTVTLKHRSGAVLGSYQIKQHHVLFVQLLMIFGAPFAQTDEAEARMWHRIFADIVVWSHDQIEKRKARKQVL